MGGVVGSAALRSKKDIAMFDELSYTLFCREVARYYKSFILQHRYTVLFHSLREIVHQSFSRGSTRSA